VAHLSHSERTWEGDNHLQAGKARLDGPRPISGITTLSSPYIYRGNEQKKTKHQYTQRIKHNIRIDILSKFHTGTTS
jgi:hypothetical protein